MKGNEMNRTPISGVKSSGANHYPRAPAHEWQGFQVPFVRMQAKLGLGNH